MLTFCSELFVFFTVIQVLVGVPIVGKVPTDAVGNGPTDALDTTDARGNGLVPVEMSHDNIILLIYQPTSPKMAKPMPLEMAQPMPLTPPMPVPTSPKMAKPMPLEMAQPMPLIMTQPLPVEMTQNIRELPQQMLCYSAFRHKDNAPPELIAKANQLGIKDRESGDANETHMCFGRGCQTLICYENGWAIYAMKHCLTRAEDGCDYHIGTFCAKGHPECLNCDEKDLCNDKYIELPVVIRIESIAITNGANHHLHASLPTASALLLLLIGAILCMNAL